MQSLSCVAPAEAFEFAGHGRQSSPKNPTLQLQSWQNQTSREGKCQCVASLFSSRSKTGGVHLAAPTKNRWPEPVIGIATAVGDVDASQWRGRVRRARVAVGAVVVVEAHAVSSVGAVGWSAGMDRAFGAQHPAGWRAVRVRNALAACAATGSVCEVTRAVKTIRD
eukprot:2820188-Rhodomonas_salina.1